MNTLALIPARGQSKRVPRKNLRDFLGMPLIAWSIRFAAAYPGFDRVVVSTDSEEIAGAARNAGIEVPDLRPGYLATDTASSASVALWHMEQEAAAGRHYGAIALLQPTSPIRRPERWDEAFAIAADPQVDAVVGVRPVRDHPFHAFTRAENGGLKRFLDHSDLSLRSQDLPPAYAVIGNLYLIKTAALRDRATFFPDRTAGVVCDAPDEALDIDTEDDWMVAEAIVKHYAGAS